MARVKQTKNELKAQREALQRYERFLPMLLLKKVQLQGELQELEERLAAREAEAEAVRAGLAGWVRLFSDPVAWASLTSVAAVEVGQANLAGVVVPVLKAVTFKRGALDLFATPAWFDDALDALESLVRIAIERRVLQEQQRLIGAELRTTTQRVNLFEKVRIPEVREHIRTIRIALGDQQAAAVARAKFAKGRALDYEAFGAEHSGQPDPDEEGAA